MADIVERLRNSAPKMGGAASAQCNDIEAIHLAADEIERLRAALDSAIDDLETWSTDERGELCGIVVRNIKEYRKILNQQPKSEALTRE